jgi:hypothetical protein
VGLSAHFLFVTHSPIFFSISVIFGGFFLILGTRQANRCRFFPQNLIISQEKLENWITRWESANGKIEKLLIPLGKKAMNTQQKHRDINWTATILCQGVI